MIVFITFLRAAAACLITNSHYTGIYPSDIIANGGLIGDVIFFAVSGYCLYHVKQDFIKWYAKRIYRIYLPVIMATLVFLFLGSYSTTEHSLGWYLIYPTYYHFIASIVVLYIPFYWIVRYEKLRNHIPHIMLAVFAAALVYYVFLYDKTYYHIDTVREPFIRVLFFESMLLGAYFRHKDSEIRNRFSWKYPLITFAAFAVYFASKIVFSKMQAVSAFQILNQIAIFVLLWAVMRTFAALDGKLEKMPDAVKKIVTFISDMTLEIYVVQYVIIAVLRPYFVFPVNWLAITASILLAAYILHKICGYIRKCVQYVCSAVQSAHQ